MWTRDDVEAFLSSKGKGRRIHTSGKAFGRRKNPKNKGGVVMRCHGCNSDEHLIKDCPSKGKGGKDAGRGQFMPFVAGHDHESDAPATVLFAETRPPWEAEDLKLESPRCVEGVPGAAYPMFELDTDPLQTSDPWGSDVGMTAAEAPSVDAAVITAAEAQSADAASSVTSRPTLVELVR